MSHKSRETLKRCCDTPLHPRYGIIHPVAEKPAGKYHVHLASLLHHIPCIVHVTKATMQLAIMGARGNKLSPCTTYGVDGMVFMMAVPVVLLAQTH